MFSLMVFNSNLIFVHIWTSTCQSNWYKYAAEKITSHPALVAGKCARCLPIYQKPTYTNMSYDFFLV